MVRLKAHDMPKLKAFSRNFNSKVVRLKEDIPAVSYVLILFQFQSGAVKRQCSFSCRQSQLYFNSKVVRLKVKPLPSMKAKTALFQFQSGAVKSCSCSVSRVGFWYFNSKVVRLKVLQNRMGEVSESDFNSKVVRLKGHSFRIAEIPNSISIPKWCG